MSFSFDRDRLLSHLGEPTGRCRSCRAPIAELDAPCPGCGTFLHTETPDAPPCPILSRPAPRSWGRLLEAARALTSLLIRGDHSPARS